MAVYILMQKAYEDEEKVIYQYGPNEKAHGKIGYNKLQHTLIDITPVDDPNFSNDFYFKRAAQRLAVLSTKQKQEGFPDRTSIQS